MLIKIKKYICKPHLAIFIIFEKISSKFRLTYLKYSNVGRLIVGEKVEILQKTKITGKGLVTIQSGCSFGYRLGGYYDGGNCELQSRYNTSNIVIGENVNTNNNLFICCAREVTIEKNTLIGEGVMIIDFDAHGISPDERNTSIGNVRPIYIGENVWIGSRATILSGTKIGKNSIVAAGAVVREYFPKM